MKPVINKPIRSDNTNNIGVYPMLPTYYSAKRRASLRKFEKKILSRSMKQLFER